MPDMTKTIAVLGAGAIGSSVSADLSNAGLDVTVIDQWPAQVEALQANGLCIKMPDRELRVPIKALHLCDLRPHRRANAEYLVGVTSTRNLRGGEQVWAGEQVHIKSEYVSSTYQRHFSKGRTITLGAVGVTAFAFIVTRSLFGSGQETDPGKIPPDGSSIRVP